MDDRTIGRQIGAALCGWVPCVVFVAACFAAMDYGGLCAGPGSSGVGDTVIDGAAAGALLGGILGWIPGFALWDLVNGGHGVR